MGDILNTLSGLEVAPGRGVEGGVAIGSSRVTDGDRDLDREGAGILSSKGAVKGTSGLAYRLGAAGAAWGGMGGKLPAGGDTIIGLFGESAFDVLARL